MLGEVFSMLVDRGELHPDWVDMRLDRQDRTDGDIGALTTRIAFVRTWAYIANRRGWVADPEAVQARTRAIEDRLSDALHERLTWRFVDHRVGAARARPRPARPVPEDVVLPGRRPDPDSPFAAMLDLELPPDPRAEPAVPVGPSPLQREAATARADALVGAPDSALALGEGLDICFEGEPCARLSRGPEISRPQAAVIGLGPADGPTRRRVQKRLQSWVDETVAALFAPLRRKAACSPSPAGRGLLIHLEAGLGSVSIESTSAAADLAPTDMRALARLGIRAEGHVYALDLLKPQAIRCALRCGRPTTSHRCPDPGRRHSQRTGPGGTVEGYYAAIGYPWGARGST